MVHRISHQPGWLASCNTGQKVISAHRSSTANRASPAHVIRPFEGNQKNVCPVRIELAFTVLRLYGFPSTDCSGFCVKNFSTWLTVLPALCFQVRLEVFLSFLHAKVGRERLVYFIVSNLSVLNLYFIKWLGLNLRRTAFDLLVTFFTFKDIDSMFWWLFCTFRNSTCLQLFNVSITRLSNTSFGFLPC